jgi:hypothetical protein
MKPAEDERKEVEYLMTVNDVKNYFKVSEQTVRLWITQGKLQAYRVPPEDEEEKKSVPASKKRTPLFVTRQSVSDWTIIYYKL